MSNQSPSNYSREPLSVGNVVSAGLRIYRDNFKLYYKLALQAYLWVIIPIYGWAKFAMISGLISRLAFSQVNEKPETESEARTHVNHRLWTFFLTGLLLLIMFFVITFVTIFIGAIVFYILATIVNRNPVGIIMLVLLGIIAFIAFLVVYVWFFSKISLAELFIAIEDIENPTQAIGRSWKLTQGYVGRLQLIFFVAFLISMPISAALQIGSYVAQIIPLVVLLTDSGISILISFLLNLALTIAGGALLIPFWQAIKAVIYYDLRSRKEGIELSLRDR